MTNSTKLNYTQLTSMVTDASNPILNKDIIVVPEVTGTSAYAISKAVLGNDFTFTTVNETGALILTSTGKVFAYYSAIDNSLTVEAAFSIRFSTVYGSDDSVDNNTVLKVDTDAIKENLAIFHSSNLGLAKFNNTTNSSFTSSANNDSALTKQQESEMEAHYNNNYGTYNNAFVETNLDADRSKFSGAFGVQQQGNALQPNNDAHCNAQHNKPQQKRVLTVDGACSGNPGKFEFQMVWEDTKERLNGKHYGELIGTNNIAEFLGLSTAIHHVIKNNLFDSVEIHSDSVTALAWLRKGTHSVKSKNVSPEVYANLDNALKFINANRDLVNSVTVVKHDTKANGEIAADFNRKK